MDCPWSGSQIQRIPVRDFAEDIGPDRASEILFFNALTGCDVASDFRGKGKKTAWQTWNVCGAVSETFTNLSQHPTSVANLYLKNLERFVILMYDRYNVAAVWMKQG